MDTQDDLSDEEELHAEDADQTPDSAAGGKGKAPAKGRKKEAGESRKAQNRIAQREFRLRKQQYIRELETRIEVLSANSDQRFDHLRDVVRALVDENRELRAMLSSMGSFFKDNLSSVLPRMGMTPELFDEIITKGNSQTALDAFIKSKERIQGFPGAATPAIPSQTLSHSIFAGNGPAGVSNSPKTVASTAAPKRKRTATLPAAEKIAANIKATNSAAKKEKGTAGSEPTSAEGERASKRKAKADGPVSASLATQSPEVQIQSSSSTSTPQSAATGSHDLPPSGYSILSMSGDFGDLPSRSADLNLQPAVATDSPSGPGFFNPVFSSGPLASTNPAAMSHLSYQHQAYSDMLGIGNSVAPQFIPPNTGQPRPGSNPFAAAYSQPPPGSEPGPSNSSSFSNLEQPLPGQFDYGAPFDFSFSPGFSTVPTPGLAPVASVSSNDQTSMLNPSSNPTFTSSPKPILRPIREDEDPEAYFQSADVQAAMAVQGEKHQQAMQLIGYHLSNFRANPSYHLPPSLVPTTLQRTIPHGRLIDGIPLPTLRDAMIRHRDKFNLGIALHRMFAEFQMHGTDCLDSSSWEIGIAWMKLYPFLVDQVLVDSANRWRAQRGDPLIDFDEIRRLVSS